MMLHVADVGHLFVRAVVVATGIVFSSETQSIAQPVSEIARQYSESEVGGTRYEFYLIEKSSIHSGFAGKIEVRIKGKDSTSDEQRLFFITSCEKESGQEYFVEYRVDESQSGERLKVTINPDGPMEKAKSEPTALWFATCKNDFRFASQSPNTTTEKTGHFKIYANRDLFGGDLSLTKGIDVEKCTALCRQDTRCKAFSFDKWNQWCFLKSAVTDLTIEPSSISAVRSGDRQPANSSRNVRIDKKPGRSLVAIQFRKVSAPTLEVCESDCVYDSVCVAFTFRKKTKACSLFDSADSIVRAEDADSGLKTQNPP